MRRFALCALVLVVVVGLAPVVWGEETQEAVSEQESPEAGSDPAAQPTVPAQETPPAHPKAIVSKDGLAGLREVSILV